MNLNCYVKQEEGRRKEREREREGREKIKNKKADSMRRGGIVQGEKNRNGFNRVNIESNGAAIGTKPSGMTLLLGSSAICN